MLSIRRVSGECGQGFHLRGSRASGLYASKRRFRGILLSDRRKRPLSQVDMRKPNVALILADDMGYDHFGERENELSDPQYRRDGSRLQAVHPRLLAA